MDVRPAPFATYPDVYVDGNAGLDGAAPLLYLLRPHWRGKTIVEQPLNPGFINHMACYHLAEDTDITDGIVVRVYGCLGDDDGMEGNGFLSRNNELIGFQRGQIADMTPTLLGCFGNGLAYSYIHGRQLEGRDLTNLNILSEIAYRVADFHSVDIDQYHFYDRVGGPAKLKTHSCIRYFRSIKGCFQQAPKHLPEPAADERYQKLLLGMQDEALLLEQLFEDMKFQTTLSHNDCHLRNLMYDDKTGQVKFVDLEMVEMNFTVFDIALCFALLPFYNMNGYTDGTDLTNRSDLWNHIVEMYIRRKYELDKTPRTAQERNDELEQLQVQHQMLILSYPMYWFTVVISVVEATNFPEVDTLSNMERCREMYFEAKPKLLDLHSKYMARFRS